MENLKEISKKFGRNFGKILMKYFLTEELRYGCIEICYKWLKRIEDEPDVMERVITDDERWIHHFDPATKQESRH